jgi:hypothetical protein
MLLVYLELYQQIFPEAALRMSLTETQISQRANQVLEESGYETSEFSHNLSLRQNLEQIRYLQKQFGMKHANEIIKENTIPVYYWKIDLKEKATRQNVIRISHDSEEEARDAIEKALSDTISLNMTMDGDLVRLNVQLGEKDQIDTLSYEAAFALADSFLKKFQPDHFHSYEFIPSNSNNQFPKIEHKFAWKNNDPVYGMTETINISIYGRYLNLYQDSFAIPKDIAISSSKSELKEIPVIISLITIAILFIVLLIRKLRKDEIDLKNNVVLSIIISIAWIAMLVHDIDMQYSGRNIILTILIPILVTTPFIFLGFLMVSSISESGARDVWEEKLRTFDALRKRTIFFPQFSLAIFRGLALAFLSAGLLAFLLKIASLKFHFYMDFEKSNITEKISFLPVIYILGVGLMTTGFYEFIFRLFFVSALRKKVQTSVTIIIVCALISIFSYSGYANLRITPYFLNLMINFFLAALMVAFFIKWDFITVWWGALAYFLLRELYPFTFFDNGFYHWNGLSLWIIFGIAILVGLVGYFRKVDIRDIQSYVPSYIIRREERERMLREFEIARRVQFSFLPREKPKLKGIDLASICIPAMEVGGDYYDFIELDDHRLGVVIGDVSGKGISAAFHMTLTKGFLKSQVKSGLSPREIMINLNELFYENVERGTFISMIYGIFDLHERTFTFARAGHNPLIIQKGLDENVEVLCPKGLALGLEKGTIFERITEEYKIGIHTSDIFVFYTDGFSEAMNNRKEEFGEDRLQNILKKNSLPSAEHIINHIKAEIINFVGNAPQHDDMTMLVVKVL